MNLLDIPARKDTTQDYRRGFAEGEAGERNIYLLEAGCRDIEEYNRGFVHGLMRWEPDNA